MRLNDLDLALMEVLKDEMNSNCPRGEADRGLFGQGGKKETQQTAFSTTSFQVAAPTGTSSTATPHLTALRPTMDMELAGSGDSIC